MEASKNPDEAIASFLNFAATAASAVALGNAPFESHGSHNKNSHDLSIDKLPPSQAKKELTHESGSVGSVGSSDQQEEQAANQGQDALLLKEQENPEKAGKSGSVVMASSTQDAASSAGKKNRKNKKKQGEMEEDEYDKMVGRPVSEPLPTDILLGRGKGVSETAGNIRFLRLVDSHVEAYLATHRQSRGKYCGTVVKEAQRSYGARFLEPSDSPEGPWKIADSEKARKKVGQAVRYRLRQMAEDEKTKKLSTNNKPEASKNTEGSSSKHRVHTKNRNDSSDVMTEGTETQDEDDCEDEDDDRSGGGFSEKSDQKEYNKKNRWKEDSGTKKKKNAPSPSSYGAAYSVAAMNMKPSALIAGQRVSSLNQKHASDDQGNSTRLNKYKTPQESCPDSSSSSDRESGGQRKRQSQMQQGPDTPSNKRPKPAAVQSSSCTAMSDQLTMDDCLQILSSASFRKNPDEVNQALRSVRKLVVDTPAASFEHITNENLAWNFVCLHRGIPLVCRCMANFASHAGVQSNACFLLSELLRLSQQMQQNQEEQQPALSFSSFALIMQAAGVIEAVLKAMREHPRDRLVNNNALAMLSTFTKELKQPQKELERTLVCQCVIPQVLSALQAFGTDAKIARHAGNILWNLSMDPACRRIMVEAGATTVVSLAILQVTHEFKAHYTTLHLRILQDFYCHSTSQTEESEPNSCSNLFHLDAIQANSSPFPKR